MTSYVNNEGNIVNSTVTSNFTVNENNSKNISVDLGPLCEGKILIFNISNKMLQLLMIKIKYF